MIGDQKRFVGLVRALFSQPQKPAAYDDLPLAEPVDFHWTDSSGAYRLRLFIEQGAVVAVHETARPGEAWGDERRVLVTGDDAVWITRQLEALVEVETDGDQRL